MKNLLTLLLVLFGLFCSGQNLISQTASEQKYLKARDSYIKYFSSKDWNDFFFEQEKDSLDDLEKKLRDVMKDSPIHNTTAKINLETLFEGIGFGMLDGLTFHNDSLRIFYTTKNLFMQYFHDRRLNKIDLLTPEELENIFQSTFYSDAALTNFTFLKISQAIDVQAYGMVGTVAQDIGPLLPQYILVFISKGNFIYMIEKDIKNQISEIPACKSVWESNYLKSENNFKEYQQSNLKDTLAIKRDFNAEELAWDQYCECYRKKLSTTAQFIIIKKQMDTMVHYIFK